MSTTATAPDRAEISRQNGAKSHGPKTPEGKNRSKFNALKHGMSAKTLVLPGEDAEVLQLRIDTLTDDLQPRNGSEQYLVVRAATVSWQLDRADRADTARLASMIRTPSADDARRQEAEAVILGPRLFHDLDAWCRPFSGPESPAELKPRTFGSSALADNPDHPAALLYELESTAAGCQWLLDRWAPLRLRLERDQTWETWARLIALRLLGKPSVHAIDDPIVAAVLPIRFRQEMEQAERAVAMNLLGEEPLEVKPASAEDEMFEKMWNEQEDAAEAAAAAALPGIVERAIARLEDLARGHRERAEAEAAEQAARLSFDGSVEGERLRRYQMSCNRTLLRTLDTLLKIRRAGDREGEPPCEPQTWEGAAPCGPADTGVTVAQTFAGILFGSPDDPAPADSAAGSGLQAPGGSPPAVVPAGIDAGSRVAPIGSSVPTGGDSADPAVPATGTPSEPEPADSHPNEQNEPTTTPGDHQNLQNEPTTAAGAEPPSQPATEIPHQNPQNEPGTPGMGRDIPIHRGRPENPEVASGGRNEVSDSGLNPREDRNPGREPAVPARTAEMRVMAGRVVQRLTSWAVRCRPIRWLEACLVYTLYSTQLNTSAAEPQPE